MRTAMTKVGARAPKGCRADSSTLCPREWHEPQKSVRLRRSVRSAQSVWKTSATEMYKEYCLVSTTFTRHAWTLGFVRRSPVRTASTVSATLTAVGSPAPMTQGRMDAAEVSAVASQGCPRYTSAGCARRATGAGAAEAAGARARARAAGAPCKQSAAAHLPPESIGGGFPLPGRQPPLFQQRPCDGVPQE